MRLRFGTFCLQRATDAKKENRQIGRVVQELLLRGASTTRHGSILQNNIPAEDEEMSSWLRKAASLAFGLQRATVNGVKISPKHELLYRTQTRSTVENMSQVTFHVFEFTEDELG